MLTTDSTTRQQVLQAALKKFAHCGYEGTTVQDIVEAARLTKPTLYYYFANKAELYQALVDYAHDERLRLMQVAAERGRTLADKLVEILSALFEFLQHNRDLMRIAFATAFAAPGELPAEIHYVDKCGRNFEFIHDLIKRGQATGELDRRFDSKELAFGIYGQLNIYVMAHLLMPDCKLNRETAERIVKLFLAGAGAKRRSELRENMRETLLTAAVGVACCLVFGGCKKTAGAAGAGGFPPVQVIAVEAKRQPVTESLSLIGSLAANEMVEIKAETDGTVQEIPFNEGQRVEQGQLLIQLDETKFATALAEAEGNFKLSQANFERAKQLFADKLISQQEYDQTAANFDVNRALLDRRKRELKDARIYAPFSGIMGARNFSPGQVIARNTVLSWLVDLDPIKVEFNVPERFLSQVQVGQTLDLKVAAYPTNRFQGKVYFIAPSVDPNTRTTLVKAEIPNPSFELKPGMFASLDLTVNVRENSIVIPEIALSQILDGDRANVFTVGVSNTVQLKSVKLGVRLPGQVEVLSGLDGGERVIVEGIQKVGPGAIVKVAAAQPAEQHEQKGDGATSGE